MEPDYNLNELLEYVKEQRAIDFSAYRMSTIRRRLNIRLSATGMSDYAAYYGYVTENPAELDDLIDSLTIKVSCFFRNPFVFEALHEFVLPELLNALNGDELRIWCAGCARGEEPYSVAILLKELMRKEGLCPRKIFIIGTDIDREALDDAAKGLYSAESLSEIKKGYLNRYFTVKNGLYMVSDEIKSMVTFAYHDVTTVSTPKEGVFSDYHMILCRNVLIYFERELYEKVLRGISGFILKGGYLVMGEAEHMPSEFIKGFEEVLTRTKIFWKK
ncbi:MAG TPA: chemotaxis protein CheR [Nitrospiraceae bacterium]|nr:MAG: hypothetical protein A2Z82_05785 [Nitrospirae bacterium GWA2_46_11]HCZ10865.1 chemotaxis protein CheR [Nitrospiraceae bacterium]